jgi:hypothetical protein
VEFCKVLRFRSNRIPECILQVTDPNTTNEKGGYAALFSTGTLRIFGELVQKLRRKSL